MSRAQLLVTIAIVLAVIGVIIYIVFSAKKTANTMMDYYTLSDPNSDLTAKYPEAVQAVKAELIKRGEKLDDFYIKFDEENTKALNSNSLQFEIIATTTFEALKKGESFLGNFSGKDRDVVYNKDLKTVVFTFWR
jgi:hypothetical protein